MVELVLQNHRNFVGIFGLNQITTFAWIKIMSGNIWIVSNQGV